MDGFSLFIHGNRVVPHSVKKLLKQAELAIRRLTLRMLERMGGNKQAMRATPGIALTLPASPRIIFLRQDRIGDAIVTTPLLLAVRKHFPTADITMLLGLNNQAIAPLLPIECRTVVYRKSPLEDMRMLSKLRSERYDVLIDLTDNASVTSSMLVAAIKARYAIGIEKENAVVYDVLVPRIDRGENHIARRIAELLRPLGIDPETIDLKPVLDLATSPRVNGRLGINISAGTESRWAPDRVYAQVAITALSDQRWSEVVIYSEPKDEMKARDIVLLSGNDRVRHEPSTKSFGDFAKALSSVEVLITPDTSVVHLAAALGIPQAVIFAPLPEGLQYWTPTGVPYEMMVQHPSLSTLEPAPVNEMLRTLVTKLDRLAATHPTPKNAL